MIYLAFEKRLGQIKYSCTIALINKKLPKFFNPGVLDKILFSLLRYYNKLSEHLTIRIYDLNLVITLGNRFIKTYSLRSAASGM